MQAGEAVPREAFVVLYERSERRTYEAVVSLTDEEVVSWRHIEGVQSPITFEEFMACEAAVQADSGLAGGDAQARRRGLLAGDDRPVGGRLHGRGGRRDRAPDPAPADLGPLRAGRARLRPADRGPRGRVRPRRDGGRRRPRLRRRPAAAQERQLRHAADDRPGQRPARSLGRGPTSSRSRSPSPKGPRFTVEGHHGALAEVAAADRLHAARGARAARHRLRGPRHACGRSSTARRWRRCSCPTATRRRRTASRTSSTWASTASAGSPTRSSSAATAWGRSATSTASSTTRTASR